MRWNMSEREVWAWMAALFTKAGYATVIDSDTRKPFFYDAWWGGSTSKEIRYRTSGSTDGSKGMCGLLSYLEKIGRIPYETRARMEEVIYAVNDVHRPNYPYLYACTQAGARRRAKFCERQVERLKRARKRSLEGVR